ncbi:uncharacterized protein CcaverHIS019_0405670 [Cutaneotrichosporon cavernicola]|uniref:Sugar phosphate transporter domain-containing protein n=1 Tax=Cutaneotrichosporon cavernicola TaxID=279322 RepID=A0AA48L4F0_9TREE|nr:uncharacterized protein CcaverHIS019_0405670 [Cutaneotrichosporon cavernicola]BEI91747.1 hypothetical protein CcaverHIS019_0405670 [Cutaneotrichosporon cavernicola]BEI99520.1 hypothetical protein CcaverHIS631_0405630 [Cutaneotrichosporon cavernicola]BEJ07298.1 hypothetical protein CcaverHIS641_0405670 [Cutaneotrichosporon cavernicola]
MTDPRQRAPFAHVSSSLDLRGYADTPPSSSPARFGNNLGVQGGPGFFAAPPPQQPSGFARAANAAGAALGGFGLARKSTDQGIDTSNTSSFGDALTKLQHRASALLNGSESGGRGIELPSVQTLRFVFLCILWYASSAVSSNTGKVILNSFKFPLTLTIVQFAFVCGLCWIGSSPYLKWTARLRSPTLSIIRHTLPMAFFQVGGHIFGSLAISRVPVSTVHTIKALSPCFTVATYVFLFGVKYSPATYLSLVPLTLGVMLACSFDISFNNIGGLICAFGSTIIFVSQNIFFKKVMPSPGSSGSSDSPRLDKINLLFFSSGMAFLLMVPMWLYYDAPRLLAVWWGTSVLPPTTGDASAAKVVFTFVVNGTVHFAQILIAFALLSSTSPVTYSIASLIKRIAVICLAIIWFNQPVYAVQAIGIGLTAVGLWMYNAAKRDVDKGEKRMRQVEAQRDGMLPTTRADQLLLDGVSGASTPVFAPQYAYASVPEFLHPPPPKDHASPRPVYHHFEPVAIKTTARPMYPYPSPPASTASSPPLAPQRDDPSSPVFVGA